MDGNEPPPATLSRLWLTVARIRNEKRASVIGSGRSRTDAINSTDCSRAESSSARAVPRILNAVWQVAVTTCPVSQSGCGCI